MRCFRLWLALSGLMAACGSTSPDGLFDPHGASGGESFGGSNGAAGSTGAAGVEGFGGSSSAGAAGSEGFGGASAAAGSSGDAAAGADAAIDPGDGSADQAVDAPPACPTGSYAGTLSGPYQSRLGSSQFAGRVEFTIGSDGAVSGTMTATSNTTGRASMDGKLDCTTGNVEIDLVDGSYDDLLGTVRYSGTMSATYRADTRSFPDGQWTITEPNPSYGGQGTWSASASVSAARR